MKKQYIKELAEGAHVSTVLVIAAKEMRNTRMGDAYLWLELIDKTGRIPGIRFKPDAQSIAVPRGSAVQVAGRVTKFRGVKRISIDRMSATTEYDAADILPSSQREIDELRQEFRALANGVKDSGLRRVLRAVFGDKEFFSRFVRCPGSQSYHHAYLGGLLEHTVDVASLCKSLGSRREGVDLDLLMTAALLHDIGKVDELEFEAAIDYSDEGRLLGHVILGERRVQKAIRAMGLQMPKKFQTLLSHAILSHHGELEWGSPKRPSTLEALLLHHVDNLDAKTSGFMDLVSGATAVDERWTDADNLFRRPLYAPASLEADRPFIADEDGQHFRATA